MTRMLWDSDMDEETFVLLEEYYGKGSFLEDILLMLDKGTITRLLDNIAFEATVDGDKDLAKRAKDAKRRL